MHYYEENDQEVLEKLEQILINYNLIHIDIF
jgi:hypothetical protein